MPARLYALALLLAAAGCDPTYHARLDDGAGLAEGSPVYVSQVRVGEVRAVRVIEGQVDVELRVEREHELTLRADTCAMAVRGEAGPALALHMGAGRPLEEPRAIPQCELSQTELGDFMRELGEGFGQLLRSFGEGLLGGGGGASGGGAPPSPSPAPTPDPPPSPAPVPAPGSVPPPPGVATP